MKTLLGVVLILAILAAGLEGAADVGSFGSAGVGSGAEILGDLTGASSSEPGDRPECPVCTPFCHCGVHGSALVAAESHDESSSAAPLAARLEAHYFSLSEPPTPPPPIV